MSKLRRSEYIIVSRAVCRVLFKSCCFGKGSLYLDNLAKGLADREISKLQITKDKIETALEALVKQRICGKKKKEHGWKYYLNMNHLDKIKEIIKETGSGSLIPTLLMLG
jgi:transcription initiation factor IIE alpha subunit